MARPLGQLSLHSFFRAEIPECAEVERSGKGGVRVINRLNCALDFAFRQIPPLCRVQSSEVSACYCHNTSGGSAAEPSTAGELIKQKPQPFCRSPLKISPGAGTWAHRTGQLT